MSDENFSSFLAWANKSGYDTAHTYDTERSVWVALNPATNDLWAAWQAAQPAPVMLTEDEIERICSDIYIFLRCTKSSFDEIARAIEAAVLKKNRIGE